jgi:hypothetical protein
MLREEQSNHERIDHRRNPRLCSGSRTRQTQDRCDSVKTEQNTPQKRQQQESVHEKIQKGRKCSVPMSVQGSNL